MRLKFKMINALTGTLLPAEQHWQYVQAFEVAEQAAADAWCVYSHLCLRLSLFFPSPRVVLPLPVTLHILFMRSFGILLSWKPAPFSGALGLRNVTHQFTSEELSDVSTIHIHTGVIYYLIAFINSIKHICMYIFSRKWNFSSSSFSL